jgi:hypothetical protein
MSGVFIKRTGEEAKREDGEIKFYEVNPITINGNIINKIGIAENSRGYWWFRK